MIYTSYFAMVHKVAKYLDGHILLCYERPEAFCHRHIVAK